MSALAISAARLLTPLEEIPDAVVVVRDGTIVAAGPRAGVQVPAGARPVDARGATLVPGFVDVHIHGAGGRDVMEGDAAALTQIAVTVASSGTTSLVATTVTADLDSTCRSVQQMASYIDAQAGRRETTPAAEFLGVHFEGPFINTARRGVHPAEWILPPSADAFRRMLDAAAGRARILTLAPEIPGSSALINSARQAGLVIAVGHTDATYDEAQSAFQQGVGHAVHVYNAMRPFSHRDTGVLGAVLTSPQVTAELIADGVHVDAAAIRVLLAAKGDSGVVLVSDGTAATGMPDGTYALGTLEVKVSGGVCRNAEGKLAGSTLTLDRAIRHLVSLSVPLRSALRMATLNPARVLGLDKKKGTVAVGADADLVLLDEELSVAGVMTRGTGLSGLFLSR